MFKRLCQMLEENRILPAYQFGYQEKYSTIEQRHQITDIRGTWKKKYCSSAFLDITQSFDIVWNPGLFLKIRKILPHAYYRILEYLTYRRFQVKFKDEITTLRKIEAGVPQGSVLGPILYLYKWPPDIRQHKNCYIRRLYSNLSHTWRSSDGLHETPSCHQ
jgi:hypothetical protein